MKMTGHILLGLTVASLIVPAAAAKAQSIIDLPDAPSVAIMPLPSTAHPEPMVAYVSPTQKTRLRNYFFDAFGPYPIVGAALAAGINQAESTPPEWRQGAEGYAKRFSSNFGIAAVSTTTRYALSRVFGQDALYYRCECTGIFPRLRHAAISTFTARRGEDGHRVFSLPALVAPYVGTMTAVYGWYPGRYDARDAFRMGNYSLLAYGGGNIALEFIFSGSHSLISRMHLNNLHGAPAWGSHH